MSAAVALNGSSELREIRLYGVLGKKFGRVHRLAVASVREAMQALGVVLPGFAAHLVEHSAPGYHVFLGKRGQCNIGEDRLDAPVSQREAICVVPVVAGAKRAGVFQIILGAVLLVASLYPGLQFLAPIGWSLVLGGVVQLFMPQRSASQQEQDRLQSYSLGGPINTTQQGLPVPLIYGRVITGGAVISGGLATEELVLATAPGSMPPKTLPAEQPLDPFVGDFGGAGNVGGNPGGTTDGGVSGGDAGGPGAGGDGGGDY